MKKGLKRAIAIASAVTMLGGTVGALAACKKTPEDEFTPPNTDFYYTNKNAVYTLNQTYSFTAPNWNPHTWETNDDQVILSYITMGFYDLQLNETKDGYDWVCELAAEFPKDVTSDYVGQYGVKSGESGKVWEIALNPKACWDDGTGITADDYVYSLQQQLNPDMLNRRADSYVGGDYVIYGARNYLYSHTMVTYESVASRGYQTNAAAIADGKKLYFNLGNFFADGFGWAEGKTAQKLVNYDAATYTYTLDSSATLADWVEYDTSDVYLDPDFFAFVDEEGNVDISGIEAEEKTFDDFVISPAEYYQGYAQYLEVGADFDSCVAIAVENKNLDDNFEHVGIKKLDTYKILIAITDAVDEFYSKYYLTSSWLVKRDVYDACKVTSPTGLVTSTYCTSKETSPSYGPYMLSKYTEDVEFELTYNPYWYGYGDGKHEGQFQTTGIKYRYIDPSSAHSTTKQQFFQGTVDDLDFTEEEEYTTYGSSKYYNVVPESYTMQLFMTTNANWLEEESTATENHKPLQLQSFRQALSYSIDRQAYCAAYYPASQPGFGILNYLYAIDPNTGALYRDTDAAKRTSLAYAQFIDNGDGTWTARNGNKFDNIDDAFDAITGYDPDYAAELFQQAYQEAKAQGLYTDGEAVVLEMRSAGTSASAMFSGTAAMFNENIAAALALCPAGTTFSSVTIKVGTSASSDEYKAAQKAGKMDISYSGWGGAVFNPWGVVFGSYIDPANSNNWGFDALSKTIDIDIEYNNKTYTASLYDWAGWLNNHQSADDYDKTNLYTELGFAVGGATTDFKVKVLAACELAQLNTTVNIPLYYQSIGSLHSAKYNTGSDVYLPLIAFGGIRHVTFNYTDSEWTAFVSSNGGNLESYYLTN